MNKENRECQNCHQEFWIEPEDFQFYQKMSVPPPTWCRECRLIRRMNFRNERALYRRNCDLCKKPIISTFAPGFPAPVYCRECWFSDSWDPMSYGKDYDWQKNFFVQFKELMDKVPRLAVMHIRTNLNSDYANYVANSKNTYLSYSIVKSENVLYSRSVDESRDVMDCFDVQESELVYEAVQSDNLNRTAYLLSSTNCINSFFIFDCVNCQDCFMSSNLRNKRFVFRNQQLTKEKYQEEMAKIDFGSYSTVKELLMEFEKMRSAALHKYADILKSVNCTGENIWKSKNITYSFDIIDSENLKYCVRTIGPKDSQDVYGAGQGDLFYEGMAMGFGGSRARFVFTGDAMIDSYYTDYCLNGNNLFGCIGLSKKKYCILNKQYTKEEYETLVPKIKKHMDKMPYTDSRSRVYRYGEFFPLELSPYAYNETNAQEYFPLTKDKAIEKGYRWKDPEIRQYAITSTAANLPDHIKSVSDSILDEVIGCEHEEKCNEQCTQAFKITAQELQFYRRMNLPLPRLCPNCRHYRRLRQRNPFKLWHRKCLCAGKASDTGQGTSDKEYHYQNTVSHFHASNHCPNEFQTSYAPERPEIVYCEQCYNSEVA